MGFGEKSHQKIYQKKLKKVLNQNDPFDRVILHLMTTGALNVAVVDIGGESKKSQRGG